MVLTELHDLIDDLEHNLGGDDDSEPDYDTYFSFSMRIIDLLVAHGAVSSGESEPVNDARLSSWILARQDCTSRVREAVKRGELRW